MLSARQTGYLLGHEHNTVIALADQGVLPFRINGRGDKEFEEHDVMDYILRTYRTPHTDCWEAWFSGLVDGEGHFAIQHLTNGAYQASFQLGLRIDEEPLIREIHARLQCGNVYVAPRAYTNRQGYTSSRTASFYVHNLPGCLKIADLIQAYPLRTGKRVDFGVWCEFLELKRTHKRRHDIEEYRAKSEELFQRIKQVRQERKIQ